MKTLTLLIATFLFVSCSKGGNAPVAKVSTPEVNVPVIADTVEETIAEGVTAVVQPVVEVIPPVVDSTHEEVTTPNIPSVPEVVIDNPLTEIVPLPDIIIVEEQVTVPVVVDEDTNEEEVIDVTDEVDPNDNVKKEKICVTKTLKNHKKVVTCSMSNKPNHSETYYERMERIKRIIQEILNLKVK